MELGSPGLTALATDWRKLLFPQADDAQFADGYAQAVTFGLLVARARGISLSKGIENAAQELRKTNSLIGTALRLLTDDAANQNALKTSLGTFTRVLDAIDCKSTIHPDCPGVRSIPPTVQGPTPHPKRCCVHGGVNPVRPIASSRPRRSAKYGCIGRAARGAARRGHCSAASNRQSDASREPAGATTTAAGPRR